MKINDELFILTGKISQKFQLDREQELQLFSLLNVSYNHGSKLKGLEFTVNYFDEFDMVIMVLESDLCDTFTSEFEVDEDE